MNLARISLLVLPSNYYGTFDLVIVDILTDVAESLKVTHELSVIEAAILLLKPSGIIVKNEDQGYVPGSSKDYTKYTLDLIFHDVPKYCLQVFVAGSNSLDFLTATPKDHNVETLYLKGIDDFQAHFSSWYNYGGSANEKKSVCQEQREKETDEDHSIWPGVLMIVEAENVAIPLESAQSVIPGISQALSKGGLSELESVSFRYSEHGFSHTVLAKEGFVVARCKPEIRYCGFDIQLYGATIEKLEVLKAELVAAVQSNQASSYRFVTLGMFGRPQEGKLGPPSANKLCLMDSEDAPLPVRVRKERSAADFGTPQPSTMHDYNNTSSLAQWQSQRPQETELLFMIEVNVFWVGEHVLVNHMGELLSGTVVSVGDEMDYDIKYDGKPEIEENVDEARIKRIEDPYDYSFVSKFLTTSLKFVLEASGQNIGPGKSVQKEMPAKMGDGFVVVISWVGGTAVATWDGFAGVSFNIILSSVSVNLGETIDEAFTENVLLLNFDVFPRGTGKVVNFSRDIRHDKPVWS
jgi:S-adenosylmethionine/arginine decarboxylase-like enzyme